jgi:hypothetical protein
MSGQEIVFDDWLGLYKEVRNRDRELTPEAQDKLIAEILNLRGTVEQQALKIEALKGAKQFFSWQSDLDDQEIERQRRHRRWAIERAHRQYMRAGAAERRLAECREALEEIASGPCCGTPGCSVDDPLCDSMIARAALRPTEEEKG